MLLGLGVRLCLRGLLLGRPRHSLETALRTIAHRVSVGIGVLLRRQMVWRRSSVLLGSMLMRRSLLLLGVLGVALGRHLAVRGALL